MEIDRGKLLTKLKNEKKKALDFRSRRHDQWNENYLLFRLKTQVNRLTQRQEVCVPLTKGTVKSLMGRIGENPEVSFADKEGNPDRELIIKEKWLEDARKSKIRLIDKMDKKQELLYGITYKKLNLSPDGRVTIGIKDVFDMLLDPKTKPEDIETAHYVIELGIYRSSDDIINDSRYDAQGIEDFKKYIAGIQGNETTGKEPKNVVGRNLTQDNLEANQARNERLEALGATDIDNLIAGADVICEINQHITELWDPEKKKYVRYSVAVADEEVILAVRTLKEAIGVEFYPYEFWGEDPEVTDVYSDGCADILRVPNHMVNVWYSQYFENRTLRNFGMNFYDETKSEDWEPPEYEPVPGGWYGLPGKPSEVYQAAEIPDLSSTINDMQFMINMAEKETASSDVEKGAINDARATLGEIQIAVAKANERVGSMADYYNPSWERTIEKWYLMTVANMSEKETLYRKNPQGTMVPKEISKEDIESKTGVIVTVDSRSRLSAEQIESLNKLFAIKAEFPNNKALAKAIQKRSLKIVDLTPEEIQEIQDEQERLASMSAENAPMTGNMQGGQAGAGADQNSAAAAAMMAAAEQK